MVAKGIKRLLGQPASENVSDRGVGYESHVDGALVRPTSSQYASLHVNSPITCIDKSPHADYAVIAGEEAFKTVKIDGSTLTEDVDLRAAIASQVSSHDSSFSAFKDQLNIKSVKWSHSELDTTIITASANGRVTVYDLNRISSGLEIGRIREHTRQVHKLAINPYRGNWLLSASQDGIARLFDIKTAIEGRSGPTFKTWSVYDCKADAVRDIKWSPMDGFKFACSTVSGAVLYWDTRKSDAPLLKLTKAHNTACLSISWHPDGLHLISGGLDQQCHVWDLSGNANNKQKPKYTIATPAPVTIVSWRPACWSSSARAKRAAQIAVVYDDTNPMIHIWDVARPSLPFKEMLDFGSSPKGLLWHERDLLWTVGKEGHFTQTDVAFAPKVIDRRSLSTFDFSPCGDVLMLLEERQGAFRLRPHITSPVSTEISARPIIQDSQNQNQSPSADHLGISRSDSEEDVSGSFLGPRSSSRKHKHRHSARSSSSMSTTPPPTNLADPSLMQLDDAVKATGCYKPVQVMGIGHAPSANKRGIYQYLSSRYLHRIDRDIRDAAVAGPMGPALSDRVTAILEHFAKTAEGIGQYRLSQTWRILAYTMGLLLTRRAHHHRELRLLWQEERKAEREKQEKKAKKYGRREDYFPDEVTLRKSPNLNTSTEGVARATMKSILTEEIESTSNMTTPLARPTRDSLIFDSVTAAAVSTIDKDELELSPTQPLKQSPVLIHEPPLKDQEPISSVDGYDFYDMSSFATPAIDIAAPPRRTPLRLDLHMKDQGESSRIGTLARHDSNESFQMFSTSADSQTKKFPSSAESGGPGSLPTGPHRSETEVDSSWDSSESSSRTGPERSFEYEPTNCPHRDGGHNYTGIPNVPPTLRVQKATPDVSHELEDTEDGTDLMSSIHTLQGGREDSLDVLDKDFLPQHSDPKFLPEPIDPHLLVQRTIQFETQTGSLNASVMVLLLKPLLSPGTLDDIQANAILRQYHHRLDGMMLFTEAALLRKLCYPLYPSVYSQGQPKNIGSVGYYCQTCEKPVKEGDLGFGQRMQKCYRCKSYFDGCVVCNQYEEPPPLVDADRRGQETMNEESVVDPSSPAACLWWWCQGCGHGGHTACMRMWHSSEGADFSDGCCPAEGCLHACLPGKLRDEYKAQRDDDKREELSKLVKENTRGGPKGIRSGAVKRDKEEVKESSAVESVRGALAGASTSSGERERKKSVKVVAPGETYGC
jgi:WD40 repeat protein